MAFTKVVGAGIHTLSNIASHNINSSGIITATKFVGPFDGSSGDFSGDVTIDGNLVVNGTTTTLDTNLIDVDRIAVGTTGNNVAVAVTQSGSGDLIRLYDGSTQVVTVDDEGKVGIGSAIPNQKLDVHAGASSVRIKGNDAGSFHIDPNSSGGSQETLIAQANGDLRLQAGAASYQASAANILLKNTTDNIIINAGNTGRVGIGTNNPDAPLHIVSDANNMLQIESTDRHCTLYLIDTIGSSYIQNDSGALRFGTGGGASAAGDEAEAVRITADGRVGIATYTPTAAWLDIATGSGSYDHIRMRRISSDVNIASNWSLKPYGGNLYFREGGSTDKIVFTDDPKVGIGTANPLTELHVHAADFTDITIQSDRTSGNIGGINFRKGGAATGIQTAQYFVNTNGEHFFHSQGSQKLKISSDGDLLISGADNAELKLKCGTTTGNNIIAFLNSSGTTKGNIFYDSDNNFMVFKTNGTASDNERLRIDSNGHILKGHTTPSADLHDSQTTTGRSPRFQLHGAESINAGLALISWKSGTGSYYSPNIYLARSGSDTKGTNALVANSAPLGAITFNGDDGGEFAKAAVILGEVDGTSGADNMPGRLIFKTTPSGAQVPEERLRITSSGELRVPAGIGAQLKFENQHSVTTDAAISTYDDAAGTLLSLGSNFYFNSSGAETRYNTSEESSAIVMNRNGQITLKTGDTGATATTRLIITSTGEMGLGSDDPPTGSFTIRLTETPEFNLYSTQHAQNNNCKINFGVGQSASVSGNTGARIEMNIPNTGGQMTGELKFHTNVGDSLNERLRIFSDGRVQIAGQNAIASTSLTHRLLVRSQNDSHAIAIAGRNGDHIGEISFYQSDASTKLGELEAHTTDVRLISRLGEIQLCPSGTSARATIQASSFKEIIFPQQNDNTFAQRVYRTTVSGVTAQAYTKFATVSGTELASHIKMTTHCTIGSVVCAQDWDIKVAHHHDFFVTSTSLAYTESKIKIVSNGNQNFDLYLRRSGGASQASGATYRVVIHPMSQESVTFNSTITYDESNSSYPTHEHASSTGARKITASGGVGGHFIMPGTITKGGGTFTIPHPLTSKKDTHKLSHSFIEGPQMDLIYRGKTTLVAGISTVNIDTNSNMTEGTFVLLNRDVQCFTTNETGWTNIKGSVTGNKITIIAQDNSCTDTISWMVVGERQDDTAKSLNMTDDDGNLIVEPAIEEDVDTSHLHELYPIL